MYPELQKLQLSGRYSHQRLSWWTRMGGLETQYFVPLLYLWSGGRCEYFLSNLYPQLTKVEQMPNRIHPKLETLDDGFIRCWNSSCEKEVRRGKRYHMFILKDRAIRWHRSRLPEIFYGFRAWNTRCRMNLTVPHDTTLIGRYQILVSEVAKIYLHKPRLITE